MKRLIFLLTLPYVVTVTDMKVCDDLKSPVGVPCSSYPMDLRIYHLPGFQDCVSSSTAQCSYLQEIADDLNRAHEAGYRDATLTDNIPSGTTFYESPYGKLYISTAPYYPMTQTINTSPVCHKLVGGMMESVPCGPDAEIDHLNKQNKDLQDIVDQFGRGSK